MAWPGLLFVSSSSTVHPKFGVGDETNNSPGQAIYYKIAGPSTSSNFSLSNYGVSTRLGAHVYEFSGVSVPITTSSNTGTGTAVATNPVTATAAGQLVLAAIVHNQSSNTSPSFSGWTSSFVEQNDFRNGGNGSLASVYTSATVTSSGAGSYSTTVTATTSQPWRANMVVFGVASVGSVVSGTVFEDVNYGGGAGRNLAAASGVARSGATVELYDAAGAFVGSTTTDGSGLYSFTVADGSYTVRVVNSTVTSSRTGYISSLRSVQTFLTDASSGTAVPVTDKVGGEIPNEVDAPINSTSATLAALNAVAGQEVQSPTPVTMSGSDITGVDFGFNFDVIANTNDGGQGSLEQFLTNANTLGDDASLVQSGLLAAKENAVFMISNGSAAAGLRAANDYFVAGAATINPTSALPTISTPIVLDAQKQPGWTTTPVVLLDGNDLFITDGLVLSSTADGSTVRGLVIRDFGGDGIEVQDGSDGHTITGNYLGGLTPAGGDAGAGEANSGAGINLLGANCTIGAATATGRNVITRNLTGISISGAEATGNVVAGNRIGTDAAGTTLIGGTSATISVAGGAESNTIGGVGAGNLIVGSGISGILITGAGTTGNEILGNTIGTDATGTLDWGNTLYGVQVGSSAGANLIGGPNAGEGNVIAFNGFDGVAVDDESVQSIGILGNSIYSNTGLGIDLGVDDVNANNGTKDGALANSGMDHPVFTTATLSGTTLTLTGYVGSAPSQAAFADARVEVFESDDDASGNGEGMTYLGFLTASGSNGDFSGTLDVSGLGLAVNDKITGTATDASDNTSEFGANASVTGTPAGTIVKRAYQLDGIPIINTSVLPTGTPLRYMLYINNTGAGAINDVSVQDVLDAAYGYDAGSIRIDNSVAACAATTCTAIEEAAILAAVVAETASCGPVPAACTDAVDADPVSWNGTNTIDGGNQAQANGQLDIAADSVWAMVFTVTMQ